jgi:flagellar basal-body rod modification protein FlgD
MAIAPATLPGVAATSAAAAAGPTLLGKDDFLRLLVTQLTHQDPLNPLDQNQFMSQTAQFAQLEELQNMSRAIADLAATATSGGAAQAAVLLGKTVKVAGRDVRLDGQGPASLAYTVEGSATPVQIQITDQQGTVVRTISTFAAGPGAYTVAWDGRDAGGRPLPPGSYYYRVSALSAAGHAVAFAAEGPLDGLDIRDGQVRYQLAGGFVRPEDIIAVRQ